MIIVNVQLGWLHASAVTAYPFVFADPSVKGRVRKGTLKHEAIHYAQQRRWCLYGLGVGLIVWWLLYLLAFPVKWNPWRRKWESEAYRACGFTEVEIARILRESPYYLS